MRAVRSLIWRLGNLVRPSRTEREMGDELTFHIQSRAEDLVRKGLSRQPQNDRRAWTSAGSSGTRNSVATQGAYPWLRMPCEI